ncbi:MAG: amino acid adenylation domain-containing protein [Treponemataceae bacterium]|nr:amino acid adenylation domain-containing protein [Treponemataceae bacterium]
MKYTVLDYLEETSQKFPNKTAFSDVNDSMTWAELVSGARQYAAVIANFFKPGAAVPIMCDKNINTIKLFFGCLYAGCFYSFFDSTFPESRITSMMNTLCADHIITEPKNLKKLSSFQTKFSPITTEDLLNSNKSFSDERRRNIIDTDIVYANFTSGSTGTPKAVTVSHRSVIDFITCFTELFNITSDEQIANQAPFDFDVSVKDIFSAIFTGATVHLIPKMYFSMPAKLIDFLVERNITSICWAVSAVCIISSLNGFTYKIPSSIKKVMFSGEVMPVKQLKIWQEYLPDATFINLYGPTEITCNCTYHIISGDIADSIPIGIPFPNERVFLLDEDETEITAETPNKVGELCVSGTCVATGYYNNAKTAEVFTQNPLQNTHFERIYRTGDLAEYRQDGLLYYLGRKDTQIKHMGHRIELNEIEAAMETHSDISRACCIFTGSKIESFYIGTETDVKEIIACVKQLLPTYMVPSTFTYLHEFPITKNGKIDKHALESIINEP